MRERWHPEFRVEGGSLMGRLGLDDEAVLIIASKLTNEATKIGVLIGRLDAGVAQLESVWEGPDAEQFVNEWWPEYKETLNRARERIEDIAKLAKVKVAHQRDVSGRY